MSSAVAKPSFPVKDLIKAGPDAARVIVRHAVETRGRRIGEEAARLRAQPGFDVEQHVDQLIKAHLMLARAEGAGAGVVASLAEVSAAIEGPAAVAVVGTTVLADLAALAAIQVRLSLHIAAAYGHDLDEIDLRVNEILTLHSLEVAAGKSAGPALAKGGQRVGKRLLERYLKGALLQSLKSVFRLVGIKFSRAALVRGLPFVNVPANAVVADVTTRRTAAKARDYYRTLPHGLPPLDGLGGAR